jgi:hypothetical protein
MQDLRELRTLDPKTAAKRLRTALKEKNVDLSHGECLNLVARQLGLKDWNVLAAKLGGTPPAEERISVPAGWILDGENTETFAGGVDEQESYLGQPVFWLRNEDGERGFATVMQVVSGEPYRGKRVLFSAHLRAVNVSGAATIWLRADDEKGRNIAFNNLEKLPINGALKGSSGWVRREIVIDIPSEAHFLNFGFYLRGNGEARYASLDLRIVGDDVPVTKPYELGTPTNLGFAEA